MAISKIGSNATAFAGGLDISDGDITVASGHGIDFSATSDVTGMSSELLDDYEEGTYVPTLTPSTGGSIGVNGSFNVGAYTKIGRVVHVTGSFVSDSPSSATGAVGVSLPFTCVNLADEAGDFAGSATISSMADVNVAELTAFASEGGTTLDLHLGDNINPQADLAQQFSGNETIHIGVTYFTS